MTAFTTIDLAASGRRTSILAPPAEARRSRAARALMERKLTLRRAKLIELASLDTSELMLLNSNCGYDVDATVDDADDFGVPDDEFLSR